MIFFKNMVSAVKENFLAEQTRWLAWTPFLFGLGIAFYLRLPFEPNYWWSLGVLEVTLLLFYLLRRRGLHLFFVALLLVEFGFINIQMQTIYQSRKVAFAPQTTTYLRGRIIDISYSGKGKERLLLADVSDFDKSLPGKYRLTLAARRHSGLEVGQCVELVGTIFPPEPIPVKDGFPLNRKYFYEGISAIGYALGESFAVDCPEGEGVPFRARLNALRQQIADDIGARIPVAEAGVIDSVLIGEQTRIPQKVLDNYRDSGLAHFLSVSGLHLGAIAGLVFFILRLLISLFPQLALRFDGKKWAAVGAIIFSALYLLVSGMAVPAERAFIMTTVVMLGVIFNRQAISLRMVCFAALVLLIISPAALASVSFQMSFAAVVALIAFYERYAGALAAWQSDRGFIAKVGFYLAGIVICDFVASLATMPFALYHFHRVSVYTSLANLLAGPLIGLYLMPLILACLAALPFGQATYPLLLLRYGIGWLNDITAWVSSLPHSVAYIDSLPFWGFVLIICGGWWLCVWQRPWRRWGIVPILLGIMPLFFPASPDAVFAPKGEGIAVRDNFGQMIMLPQKADNWLTSVWQENFRMPQLSKEQKKELKQIYKGKLQNSRWLDLSCNKKGCTYKGCIYFSKKGRVLVDEKQIDNSSGGYIFLEERQIKVEPLQPRHTGRPWQRNN